MATALGSLKTPGTEIPIQNDSGGIERGTVGHDGSVLVGGKVIYPSK
jgi:hypothetical protein